MIKHGVVGALIVGATCYALSYGGVKDEENQAEIYRATGEQRKTAEAATYAPAHDRRPTAGPKHGARPARPNSQGPSTLPKNVIHTFQHDTDTGGDNREVQEKKQAVPGPLSSRSAAESSGRIYVVTAYTAGPESTGKRPGDPGYGLTASQTYVKEGRTIAADWDILPPGTVVEIEGLGLRVVEDKGGAIQGHRIDLYIADLDQAISFGKKKLKVRIIKKG